jgi:hypothetical protein
MKMLLLLVPAAMAAGVAYLMWGVLLGWLFSLIPAGVAWAFLAKILCLVLVAYVGGIGLPLVILVLGYMAVFAILAD